MSASEVTFENRFILTSLPENFSAIRSLVTRGFLHRKLAHERFCSIGGVATFKISRSSVAPLAMGNTLGMAGESSPPKEAYESSIIAENGPYCDGVWAQ